MKRSIPTGRSRYLTPGHIRFFRAALEGIDLRRAWDYVANEEEDYTPARAAFTVGWIREVTIASCMSAGYPELVGVFRRDPARVKVEDIPSLEEFIATFRDGEYFSEVEMLALYKEQYGENRAVERRARLETRQRQAFDLLAKAVYRAPRVTDSIGQWLVPHVVEHLQAAGMHTLGDVRAALNRKKSVRWDEVPGVGEKWATRLTLWLDEHVIVVAPDSTSVALMAPSPFHGLGLSKQDSEVTLTKPVLLHEQDASRMERAWWPYPAHRNRLGACSDEHAIQIWLDAKAPHHPGEKDANKITLTRRAYSRIAERFLLWCQLEANIGLTQIGVEHCIHYRSWLHSLGWVSTEQWAAAGWHIPAEQWIGAQRVKRDSAQWKPFKGKLSQESIANELTVLRALFKYLSEGRVAEHNPWALLGKADFKTPWSQDSLYVNRSLTQAQRDYLLAGLDADDEIQARLALILWLGFGCGLRSAEMIGLSLRDIVIAPERWSLKVKGKGKRNRTVPLSTPVKNALLRYLQAIGMELDFVIRASSGLDPETADQPILRTKKGPRPRGKDGKRVASTPMDRMSYPSLDRIIKEHFKAKAMALEDSNPESAARLQLASMHWLRHSCAVHANRNKVPLNSIQRLLGHSNISITSRYLVEEEEVLAAAMEAFLAPASL